MRGCAFTAAGHIFMLLLLNKRVKEGFRERPCDIHSYVRPLLSQFLLALLKNIS